MDMIVLYERRVTYDDNTPTYHTKWKRVGPFKTKTEAKEYIKALKRQNKFWDYKYEVEWNE